MPQYRAPLEWMGFVIEQVLDAPAPWTRLTRQAPAHPDRAERARLLTRVRSGFDRVATERTRS